MNLKDTIGSLPEIEENMSDTLAVPTEETAFLDLYKKFVEESLEQFNKEFTEAAKDVYQVTAIKDIPKSALSLLRAAIGTTSGLNTEESQIRREELINKFEEDEIALTKEKLDATEYKERLKELNEKFNNDLISLQAGVAEDIKEDQRLALEELRKLPNGERLALVLEGLRGKIDALSAKLVEMTGERSRILNAHITNQLGIYVTRTYRIFTEEGWINSILNPKSEEELRIRQAGIEGLRADYIPLQIERRVEEINRKEAKPEGWKLLTTREKKEFVRNDSEFMAQKEAELDSVTEQEILQDFMHSYMSESNNESSPDAIYLDRSKSVDSLREKKYLPKYIRDLLGEEKDPKFNLIIYFDRCKFLL